MKAVEREKLFIWLNSIEVFGIILVLCLAFTFQFVLHELPCPLCLLQRAGMVGICVGLLFNIKFGLKPAHYSLTLLSALLTAFVALRQITLHIVPGTGHYGSAVFGLHFYTWSFIVAMCVLIYTAIILGFGVQYEGKHLKQATWKGIQHTLFVLVIAITLVNVTSAFVECGLKQCPENPTGHIH